MKRYLRIFKESLLFIYGVIFYLVSGKSTFKGYRALVLLFCLTQGKSNVLFQKVIGFFKPKLQLDTANGILGKLDSRQIQNIARQVIENGYFVLPQQLSKDVCQKIIEQSLATPVFIRKTDEQAEEDPNSPRKRTYYPRLNPEGVRYEYASIELLEIPEIQKLVADETLLAVANEYLATRPILDLVEMWWHTAFGDKPDLNAAQLYHFDMDRISWIKFFFYLTPVTTETGPHCFVAKSHRPGAISSELLDKGYVRLTDAEVSQHFPTQSMIEFVADQGTIIIEDTRGLHKGKHCQKGDRLMFEIQFSSSLFGTPHIKHERFPINKIVDNKLIEHFKINNRSYSSFLKFDEKT